MTRSKLLHRAYDLRDKVNQLFGIHSHSAASTRLLVAAMEREKAMFDADEFREEKENGIQKSCASAGKI